MTLTIEGENPFDLKFEIHFRHSNQSLTLTVDQKGHAPILCKGANRSFLKEGLKHTICEPCHYCNASERYEKCSDKVLNGVEKYSNLNAKKTDLINHVYNPR